ncbi:glycosyltransferase [Nocardioides ultimimeridianus]
MHLVLDAVAVREGSSAVVVGGLLRGWAQLPHGDRVTVLAGPEGPAFDVPDGMGVERLTPPVGGPAGAAWLRSFGVRRAARRLGADVLLAGVPASSLAGGAPQRGVILYDLRHELRPHQFSGKTRAARAVSWGWSLRRADRILTISERTLEDLRRLHPRLAPRGVAAQLGSDHADAWARPGSEDRRYALAFGHFANKNAEAVIEGWARYAGSAPAADLVLRLVGMGSADRAAAQARVDALGIADRVELMPWLDDASFAACFAGASLVLFPSDFEGFGLPAAEAVRLGIPTVVSGDPALAEVTGGHAVVAASTSADDLAAATREALARTPEQLAAGRRFAEAFTWRRTAETVRAGFVRS